ncbi:hypothetical protein BH24ACI1_BH24ACI1_25160 [soil metagenome]
MKVKYITAAFAFAVTFGFSVLLIGIPQENYATRTFAIRADNETGRQISFLLQRDDDNGREMDANIKFASSPARFAEAVNQYVNHSEKLTTKRAAGFQKRLARTSKSVADASRFSETK